MKFVPHDYQFAAIKHLHDTPRCALWMPMGGGKTVSVLTALEELDTVESIYPVLVLAPLRVARSVWPEEVAKWDHTRHLRVSVITGTPAQRKEALKRSSDIYTMNYENLDWLQKELGGLWPFKVVVADESTRLKSFRLRQGGNRAQALSRYAHQTDRFINLTGTPAGNGLVDLWGQTWFLDGGKRLGLSFTDFERRWFRKVSEGFGSRVEPFAHSQEEIQDRLRDICLTVTGLPVEEPIRNVIKVELPKIAEVLYEQMETEMFLRLGEEEITAVNAAVKSGKCLQLANGAIYTNEDRSRFEVVHDAKIEALKSIIEEASGTPVLVAYNFRHDIERLSKAFPQARRLDTNPQTIADWNAGRIPILLAHPKSAGHGLNLAQGGNILAFFGVNWNLEEHMQIIERIGPMRQAQAGLNRPVMVHYILTKATVDTLVMRALEGKRTAQDVLLEALKARGMAAELAMT